MAVVEDRAHTTRDRLYGDAEWNGRRFVVVDTGGLDVAPGPGVIEMKVQEQARLAIAQADVIVFVVEAITGLTPADQEAADLLRTSKAPVLVAANKADNQARELDANEFYELGWEETYPISALHGRGVADLLDAVVWELPPESAAEIARKEREREADEWARDAAAGRLAPIVVGEDDGRISRTATMTTTARHDGAAIDDERRWDAMMAAEGEDAEVAIAIVGRPNVGKSSLLNALLGEERVIVSDVPGTTRDAIDTPLRVGPQPGRADRHGRRSAPRPGRERSGGRQVLDAAVASGDLARRRRDPGHRRRRGADRAGRAHRRATSSTRARACWSSSTSGTCSLEKTDKTFDQYVEWIRNEAPFLDFAPVDLDQREDRPAASSACWRRPSTSGASAASAVSTGRAQPAGRRRGGAPDRRRWSRAAGPRSSTRPRSPSRRRRSCSSRARRAPSTSATGATSRTGCARRSASTARRSGSCSASARRSSWRSGGRKKAASSVGPKARPGRPNGRGERGTGAKLRGPGAGPPSRRPKPGRARRARSAQNGPPAKARRGVRKGRAVNGARRASRSSGPGRGAPR